MMPKDLKVWKIERTENVSYDEYSAAVVIAATEAAARKIHPDGTGTAVGEGKHDYSWPVKPADLTVTLIGEAERNLKAGTVICASFHAG